MLMVTPTATLPRTRPYWHVDAKWIAGILLFFSLGAGLLFYNLAALTERDQAVNISATIVADLLSPGSPDDPSGLRQLRVMAANSPESIMHPISIFPAIAVSKHDALTLSDPDLKVKLFSQITGPVYDLGLDGAARQLTNDPSKQQQFIQEASTLSLLTKSTHELIQRVYLACGVVSLLLLAALIYFSAGWGRLVSPGFVLLAVSPLGLIANIALLYTPAGTASLQSMLPLSVTNEILTALSHSYLYAFLAGVTLLLAAFIGKVITVIVQQNQNPFSPKLVR